ncbi:MAG: 3-phosphoshikimate 1-carboxyvinyltransferase [Chloroflexi bacterium]|nr:3-phosphoshikimate 1-carboxyvinyltransferase [Chloroflexota bacterium]
MRQVVARPDRLEGEVTPPGDKSISHRAAIFNGIAHGTARVANYSPGGDCASTLRCLRALGVNILRDHSGPRLLTIHGTGGVLREPVQVLNAGNSGTTMRLLAGVLAGSSFLSIITGDSSLRTRPMDRVVQPLRAMGAHILGRHGNSLPPLAILGGNLRGIEYTLPVASAQVKSCLLLAALLAQGETVLHQPAASRDHTERMFKAMGAHLEEEGLTLRLRPGGLAANDIRVPGDISSAAYWLVAACAHPNARVTVRNVGVNATRTGVLDALRMMGARLTVENPREEGGEPVADIVAESSSLEAIEIRGDIVPRLIDEVPVLAVAACLARGETVIRDVAELRVKETDRIKTVVAELARLGAEVRELPDGLVVRGPVSLRGGRCQSYGDHRLAMSLAIAGLVGPGPVEVQGAEAASVSYPGFWEDLALLAGRGAGVAA